MTEVEASPWHGNQKPVSEKQREGDSNGKSTDSGIDTDSDQTNTDTDEIPSLETFIEYTAIEAYNHARDAASNSDNTTTADSRPIAELDPSSPWGTPNFQPKGPSWAAVVARIVYVLLSPCEWCRLFEHRWRLNEFFYMFCKEWEKEMCGTEMEPTREEVFLRGVYEHVRSVLQPESTTRSGYGMLKSLALRLYYGRTYENWVAKCLVVTMWVVWYTKRADDE